MNTGNHHENAGLHNKNQGNQNTESAKNSKDGEQAMPRGLAASGATRATSCPEVARSLRSISMKTKLTVCEAEEVAAIARASGLTISALLRRSVLAQKIESRAPVPAVNTQLYAEMGRIGGTLNQLVKHANNDRFSPDFASRLTQAINSLGAAIKATRAQLLGVQ